MTKLKHIMMLSCEKASELIEKKSNFQLGTSEKVQLFIHTKVCESCKNYEKQSTEMDKLLDNHINKGTDTSEMPKELKDRIIQKIDKG